MFKKYNKCIYCNSIKLKKKEKQIYVENFYLKAIKSDLKIPQKKIDKILVYRCLECHIVQNNFWFTEEFSRKIYTNVYGQHNRGWSNLLNFVKKSKLPEHGSLFNILNKKIKIKNYAEYNSPFMGLFFNFFYNEYKIKKNFNNDLSKNIINYLSSRQVAGKSKHFQRISINKSKRYINKINSLKKKNLKKNKINKYLFTDNSSLFWGNNDNYKSVSSKAYASELFDLKILDVKNKNFKIDLYGIFHTLDHTLEPKKILDLALSISKYVVVYCHVDPKLNKQHLFSLTEDFLKYLNKRKIFNINLTNQINKKFKSPELYFICSRNKKYINKFN